MKQQINLLNQLQEFVLTRDEHRQTGDGSHTVALDKSIDALVDQLEELPRAYYERLIKKNHVVMAPMVNGSCAVCGMRLPISQAQQVRLAQTIQTCSSCGRMLFDEEEDAPRYVGDKPAHGAAPKTGVSRFSAEELMVCDLAGATPAAVIGELAQAMGRAKFVSNPDALVVSAMEREQILPTSLSGGVAFPHVRGVEGGGLTMSLGISRAGVDWDGSGKNPVKIVAFCVIPTAVSAFYMRLMAMLGDSFSKAENRKALIDAPDRKSLWKALMKATRYTIR